jgi:hypothetical protein
MGGAIRSDGMTSDEYVSFVVRYWRDPSVTALQSPWIGEIEHIQSGVRWNFDTLADLLAFLTLLADTPCSRIQSLSNQLAEADHHQSCTHRLYMPDVDVL